METKPHGWATTRTGIMFHYFGLTREGRAGYHEHGTPMALCHNAVRADSDELIADLSADKERCESCVRYLKTALRLQSQAPAQSGSKLGPGVAVTVSRGKLAGLSTEIVEASKDFPGFWWVKGGERKMMFSEGQLQAKK